MSYKFLTEDAYETKDGTPIKFKWDESVDERKTNPGWIVHQLTAYIDSQEVGYIKASYIPENYFEKFYPTVIHYVSNIVGSAILDRDPSLEIYYRGVVPPADEFAQKLHKHADYGIKKYPDFPHYKKYDEVDDETWQEIVEHYVKEYRKKYGDQYKRFKNYFVDKPFMDYINVDESHRRKGIGFNLYKKMAKELGKRGMVLYASTIQTPEAEAAWEKLKEVLPVKSTTMKTEHNESVQRFYIDFT